MKTEGSKENCDNGIGDEGVGQCDIYQHSHAEVWEEDSMIKDQD